jgi:hypothetical protein
MNRINNFGRAVLAVAVCVATAFAAAQDDTASREAAANRYLKAVPIATILDDTFNEMGKQVPQDQRAQFIAQMKAVVRADFLEKTTLDSMVKTFTADELNALADFYGSKHGSSAMLKFGVYMAQVMPAIQAEVQRGVEQFNAPQKK